MRRNYKVLINRYIVFKNVAKFLKNVNWDVTLCFSTLLHSK